LELTVDRRRANLYLIAGWVLAVSFLSLVFSVGNLEQGFPLLVVIVFVSGGLISFPILGVLLFLLNRFFSWISVNLFYSTVIAVFLTVFLFTIVTAVLIVDPVKILTSFEKLRNGSLTISGFLASEQSWVAILIVASLPFASIGGLVFGGLCAFEKELIHRICEKTSERKLPLSRRLACSWYLFQSWCLVALTVSFLIISGAKIDGSFLENVFLAILIILQKTAPFFIVALLFFNILFRVFHHDLKASAFIFAFASSVSYELVMNFNNFKTGVYSSEIFSSLFASRGLMPDWVVYFDYPVMQSLPITIFIAALYCLFASGVGRGLNLLKE